MRGGRRPHDDVRRAFTAAAPPAATGSTVAADRFRVHMAPDGAGRLSLSGAEPEEAPVPVPVPPTWPALPPAWVAPLEKPAAVVAPGMTESGESARSASSRAGSTGMKPSPPEVSSKLLVRFKLDVLPGAKAEGAPAASLAVA